MVRMVPIIVFGLFANPGLSLRLLPDSVSSSLQAPPDLHKVKAESNTVTNTNTKWLGDQLFAMAQREEGLKETPMVNPLALMNDPRPNALMMWPRSFVKKFQAINSEVGPKKRQFTFIGHNWKEGTAEESPVAALNRVWVEEFAKQRFTENDFFVDTSISWNGWKPNPDGTGDFYQELGPFDHSKEWKPAYFNVWEGTLTSPKNKKAELDEGYFRKLAESEFTLCPSGDQPWSFRFVEAMFAKSIPIVADASHASAELQAVDTDEYKTQVFGVPTLAPMGGNQILLGTVYTQKIGFHYSLLNTDPNFKYVYNETWAEENLQKALKHHTLMKEYGSSIDNHAYLPPPPIPDAVMDGALEMANQMDKFASPLIGQIARPLMDQKKRAR